MLKTEMRNASSVHIDEMDYAEMLKVIQEENENAVKAVGNALGSIEHACKIIENGIKNGGRLFYVGCGTSGRLGVLDASEIPPTYGLSPDIVVGIIAGGDTALRKSVEGAEDDYKQGFDALDEFGLTANDTVMGISVAGGAKYVLGALDRARKSGAKTVALTSNAGSPITENADVTIVTDTGAEVITGSTRMKAGTAHKLVLNMISTSVMIKCGYVYENLMINLRPSNEKLIRRMKSIVCDITGKTPEQAEILLENSGWNIRAAVLAAKGE